MASVPTIFADTNTLVGTLMRNLVIELGVAGAIQVKWSQQVMDELERTLARVQNRSPSDTHTLTTAMKTALPDAWVEPRAAPPLVAKLPHLNDQGILSAAVQGGCSLILTFNTRHFPASELSKQPTPIQAMHPDDCLLSLITTNASKTFQALEAVQGAFKNPHVTRSEFLVRLTKSGLVRSAELLAVVLDQPR